MHAVVFKKALSQIVEVSGPLHVAFHILQSICSIFKPLLLWGLDILGWKKVNLSKVSDCFQRSKKLVLIILEEIERYTIGIMLSQSDNINEDDDNIAINYTNV